ncbi:MAG: YdjC family protein [Clostridia bacterium]|jgi:predicted glycoside hydrolase/deacetylase ChbG (UPF0249 family)|nr:YdjC family protein [Clostridia bacterium]
MLKLIINADDFGLAKGCNEGIIKALKDGIATDTTIMINLEGCLDAVILAKSNGIKRIGLHLNLTCGKPLLPADEVKSLVDETGSFYRRVKLLLPNMDLKEAESELWAQVERFKETGMGLTHLDSHHHIHMYEGLRDIVIDMARQLNVPLRQTDDETRDKIRAKGVRTTEYFTWEFYDNGVSVENLCSILDRYHEGTLEIMSHPAVPDDELSSKSSYSSQRKKELEVLTSEVLKKYIKNKNIQLISFDDLSREVQNG